MNPPPPTSQSPNSPAALLPTATDIQKGPKPVVPVTAPDKAADLAQINKKGKEKNAKTQRGISRDAKEYFVENMSMLLTTGVPVGEALASISAEMPSKKVRKAIEVMITQIDEGAPFWKTLQQTGILNQSSIALIMVGEDSGRLPENLKVVAEQMHKSNMMNAKVRSALLYPTFLVVLLFIVGSGISIFLLPKLTTVFSGLDVKLGLLTRVLLGFGGFMGHYGLMLMGGLSVVFAMIVYGALHSKVMRHWAELIMFHIPGVKKLLYESELARMGFVLGSLLEAGLPIVDALNSLADSMTTSRYRDLSRYFSRSIEEGQSFSATLEGYKDRKVLPGTVRQLIISAEKSGNLSKSLLKIGTIFEDKATITAGNLEVMLEPIILILIAVAVLFIALAVILPIYSLIGGLDGSGK